MTTLLALPPLGPAALAWIVATFAALGGAALHLLMPPEDPAVAEAILLASVHP